MSALQADLHLTGCRIKHALDPHLREDMLDTGSGMTMEFFLSP